MANSRFKPTQLAYHFTGLQRLLNGLMVGIYMLMNSNLVLEFSEITDDAETKTCFFPILIIYNRHRNKHQTNLHQISCRSRDVSM